MNQHFFNLPKTGKKVLSLLLSLTLVATISYGSSFRAYAATPSDISTHWAKQSIQSWLDKGFVSGYPDGTFKPNATISRAEYMTMVNKSLGFVSEAPITFSDVKMDDWYAKEVAKAVAAGYISGYSDGTIKPENPISREEAASIITKILKLQTNADGTMKLTDSADLRWSKACVGAAYTSSIMMGYPDGSFKPQNFIMRGEAVTALDKANSFALSNVSDQTLTGFIIDEHCFVKKPVPGSDTKVCLQMPTCAATGYGIAVLQSNGSYKFYYFDGDFSPKATGAQSLAINLIDNTTKKDHVYISVTGRMKGDFKTAPDGISYPVLTVSKISESMEQTVSGYLIDKHCFLKKAIPGSDTKVCLQMPTCAATGYGIAVLQNDGSYEFYYFDGTFAPNAAGAQLMAIDLINKTTKTDHVYVSVVGTLNGDTITSADGLTYLVMKVTKMSESMEPTL